jgi:biopolymer transport protein ExbD
MRIQTGGRFRRYRHTKRLARVPTESMADIAFLLMIFFITTTVLRMDQGMEVDLPRALSTLLQPRERIAHVWIDARGRLMINDRLIGYEELAPILSDKLRRNPELVVALNSDRRTEYAFVHRALGELKKAEAVRVSFTAQKTAP